MQNLSDGAPLFKSEGVSANPECTVPVLLPRRMRAAESVTDYIVPGGRNSGLGSPLGAQHSRVLLTVLAFHLEVARRS